VKRKKLDREPREECPPHTRGNDVSPIFLFFRKPAWGGGEAPRGARPPAVSVVICSGPGSVAKLKALPDWAVYLLRLSEGRAAQCAAISMRMGAQSGSRPDRRW